MPKKDDLQNTERPMKYELGHVTLPKLLGDLGDASYWNV